MATKTISISEDAYRRLASLKRENESFSVMIRRITGCSALSKIQGILSKEQADELERQLRMARKKDAKMQRKKIRKMGEALKGWSA